jgi:hypothetical protein
MVVMAGTGSSKSCSSLVESILLVVAIIIIINLGMVAT